MARKQVVVIGGGFGGLTVVQQLRRSAVDITLIDRRNHHLFQPLLYQVATAALSPSDIAEPLRGVLSSQDNVEVLLGEVTGIDVGSREVVLGERRLPYDVLVVAAGARTTYFGNDQWAEHAPSLKSLHDALEMRRRVLSAFERAEWTDNPAERARLLTFVVVGGGPTGVELAGALREIACNALAEDFRHIDPTSARVLLVEAGPDVLGPFHEDLRSAAHDQLVALGVEVLTGRRVTGIEAGRIEVDGESIPSDTVLWTAGVRGAAIGAQLGAPLDRGGRVMVEPDLSIPGHPEVMVIGDLARFEHGRDKPVPGVAPVAIQMGQRVAANLAADEAGKPRGTFVYNDYGSMATIGRSKAVAEVGGFRMSGVVAWLLWVFVHLMTLVGHRNRVLVFVKWAWAWLTFERSSRLLWKDESD